MAIITSRHHALVKEYRRVAHGDQRLALLDGWHLLEDALDAGIAIESVAVLADVSTPTTDRILKQAHDLGASVHAVSATVLDALSPVRSPSGVASLVRRRRTALSDLLSPSPPLIVLAVNMQDPGNVGAVIRSAEAGGATGVAFVGDSADAWGWKALRAAMGSTFRLPVLTEDAPSPLIDRLRGAGVTVLATVPRGGRRMHDTDMRNAAAIMIGGEGQGLTPQLIESADARISIPMQAPVNSLNAAVATALLVYEARRQREV